MIVCASGQLRHRFWGEYSAVIVLRFTALKDARTVHERHLPASDGWELIEHTMTGTAALRFIGGGRALDHVEHELVTKFKVNRKLMTSLEKSIDYGEPFIACFDVTPDDGTKQGSLL